MQTAHFRQPEEMVLYSEVTDIQIYTVVQKSPSMVPATHRNRNLENEWLEILMHLPIKRTCIQSDKKVKV